MLRKIKELVFEEDAATMVEYALIIAGVALIGWISWGAVGQSVQDTGTLAQGKIDTANTAAQ